MKAVLCSKSGTPDVLKIVDLNKPVPMPGEILVKIYASTVTRGDVLLRKIPRLVLITLGFLFGFRPMKITGVEFAGEVEACGEDVSIFKAGDRVFGTTTGLKFGGNAEYVCVPEYPGKGVVSILPDDITFQEGAALPVGGMTAVFLLNKGGLREGIKVLIFGASGSVGSYALQIAKTAGAEVTAVCSKENVERVMSIGADFVVNYTDQDVTQSGEFFDLIFDAVGKISKNKCSKILAPEGRFVSVKSPTKEKTEYLIQLKELVLAKKIKPLIDRVYNLDEIAEAHSYVEKGHKKGNVIIKVRE
ncbi:MAG: NAD(P)-dependent alcohol dehydrogenase [Ignavibacteriales bacterium]|nr:NAD(P)-dependent alcohol dehydrogenase [Ignavibacteriales bacterium]MCF8315236.1 NAD(P)-dependent alcohol dehydrogenase [Ignavibacteriales bacterium]MCF8436872.1 NAD(P)-dependent alcohol dehydrogenase [Ignavibacteriales bacterium]